MQWEVTSFIILKPEKDSSEISVYRPIALFSCLGKLMENLVNKRLYSYIENKNHLPESQRILKTTFN